VNGVTVDMSANDDLKAIYANVKRPHALLKVMGRRGANELKSWFRNRNRTPNKLGGRRTNFWNQIASSVQSPVLVGASGVRIDVTHPAYGFKVRGGRITPKRAKALTIPVHKEAYGRTVATFERETGIELFRPYSTSGVASDLLMAANDDGSLTVYFVLRPFVDQAPDPAAFPPDFTASLLDEARKFQIREFSKRNASVR
jgi:hypothetical protein